jgi:hypothetical protein
LGDELADVLASNLERVCARDGLAVAIGEVPMSEAPIITREQWFARNTRPRPKKRPELRKRRTPTGSCRICARRATRFNADTALCDLHFKEVNDLVNHGETSAVTALVEANPEKPTGPGALRQRLKTRHAAKWTDRP